MAAHWRYKEGGRGDQAYERKINELRSLLSPAEGAEKPRDFLDRMRVDLFQDRIYAVSPKGEIVDVPVGGTPLDFAYQVHTDLGHRTRGAKVNGRMVSLDYQLKNSDTVEIVTGKTPQPSRDWLSPQSGFLASPRHRNKVRAWFRKQNEAQNKLEGRAMLDRELQRLGVNSPPIPELLRELGLDSTEALHEALGLGEVSAAQVAGAMQRLQHSRETRLEPRPRTERRREPDVEVQGIGDLLSTYARCCKPVPPEPIVGYITVGRGVSIHSQSCANLARLSAQVAGARARRRLGQDGERRIAGRHRGAGLRPPRAGARRERRAGRREDQHPRHDHGHRQARQRGAHADQHLDHRVAAAVQGADAHRAAAECHQRAAEEMRDRAMRCKGSIRCLFSRCRRRSCS